MKKLYINTDKDNPNIIIVSGSATKDLKQFLKNNYAAMYDPVEKNWLINKDEQKFDVDANKLYGQLKAKTFDRAIQREFGKLVKDDDEDSQLRYGKSILVYLEKINLPSAKKALDELHILRSKAKAEGSNLDNRQEATYTFLKSAVLATNALLKTDTMKTGEKNNIAYFPHWQDRENLAKELNVYRKQNMFNKKVMSNGAKEELDEEDDNVRRWNH